MTDWFSQGFWDDRYRGQSDARSEPNERLVQLASRLVPGKALDVGSGIGADALWLASRGWEVTATDISSVALEQGAEIARAFGVSESIHWEQHDLLTWDGPHPRSFDLVSAHFVHLPREPREAAFARLAEGVASGGHLLIVGHDPSDRYLPANPRLADSFYSMDELRAPLDEREWDIVVQAIEERQLRTGGEIQVRRDAVFHARRKGERGVGNKGG